MLEIVHSRTGSAATLNPEGQMRVILLCAGFLYGGAAWDDSSFIKPSQPLNLQQVLDAGVHGWFGARDRVAYFD